MVEFCLLGCGGNLPMAERYLSAGIISYKGHKILIDCGEGTQVSMKIEGTGFKAIDVICITHCHGDHIIGLPGLLATIANSGKQTPLTIIGPDDIERVVEGLRVIVPYLPYEVNIIKSPGKAGFTLEDNYLKFTEKNSQIEISTIHCEHSAPCIGYSFYFRRDRKFDVNSATENGVPKVLWNRLQKGESQIEYEDRVFTSEMVLGEERRGIKVSYITDTRPIENIVGFIEGSDLFICEGNYGADEDQEKAVIKKHMTFREAASLAKTGKVKKMILTHFSPAMLNPENYLQNAVSVFENAIIGSDRLKIELSYTD